MKENVKKFREYVRDIAINDVHMVDARCKLKNDR